MNSLVGLKWKEISQGDVYRYEVIEETDRVNHNYEKLYLAKVTYWWTLEPEFLLFSESEIANKMYKYITGNMLYLKRAPSEEEVKLLNELFPNQFNEENR